ncbi:MAG: hypothetical protein JWO03_3715, partial [Bacteroidetes bacterium]|nr:hypothetical protein [Bacteroidota bacterium]
EELKYADRIFAISKSDYEYLRQSYENIDFVSAFHSNETVTSQTGRGTYILYHGNLGVVENNQAALFIVKKIAADLKVPFIIAGKNPTDALKKEAKKHSHITLIENPSFEQVADLLSNAQINFLTTFQNTGIKLKLLNSLYRGRFCLVNSKMVNNTGLESLCVIEDNPNATKRLIEDMMALEFDQHHINKRKQVLDHEFSNRANATRIIKAIWER